MLIVHSYWCVLAQHDYIREPNKALMHFESKNNLRSCKGDLLSDSVRSKSTLLRIGP